MNGIDRETFVNAEPATRDGILFDMIAGIWCRMESFEKRIWSYLIAMITLAGVVGGLIGATIAKAF